MVEKKSWVVIGILLLLVSVSFASAGILDFFRITGGATQQPQNVSVSYSDMTPIEIRQVIPPTSVNPSEGTSVSVDISVIVYNFDRLNDINFSSVFVNISNGSVTRGPVQCVNVNNISNTEANFSCSVDLWYWDTPGSWQVSAQAQDIGNGTIVVNDSASFTYNLLKAMIISPDALTWPILDIGAENVSSNNHPTIINNTGNYNGTVEVTGFDLVGETYAEDEFVVNNFSTGILSGQECGIGTSNLLSDNSSIEITNAVPNPGNLSLDDGSGQERLYYCIREVPALPTQIYSTLNGISWVVSYGA